MKNIFPVLGFCLAFCLFSFGMNAQGTLQFNQVLLINAASGTVTVPSGKVWKIESYNPSAAKRYLYFASYGNVNWSSGTPEPCTGAINGSVSLNYYTTDLCPSSENSVFINQQKTNVSNTTNTWLPQGTTVLITETPCYSGASFTVPPNTPVRDHTSGIYLCGPITVNAGSVANSPTLSILEFNILP